MLTARPPQHRVPAGGSGVLFAATLLVLPGVTHATAGFSCAADDAALTFSLVGAFPEVGV